MEYRTPGRGFDRALPTIGGIPLALTDAAMQALFDRVGGLADSTADRRRGDGLRLPIAMGAIYRKNTRTHEAHYLANHEHLESVRGAPRNLR